MLSLLTASSSALSRIATPSQCWNVVPISLSEYDSSSSRSPGEHIRAGNTVFTLDKIASEEECALLIDEALRTAALLQAARFDQGLAPTGRARLPTGAAISRADASDLNCMEHLSTHADALCEIILLRALHMIDTQLPSLRTELFPGDDPEHSLAHRYKHDLLEYSSFEPAVNVYTAGGEFLPHKDHQALTVLVPLSRPDEFVGGGTGFWPKTAEPEVDQAAQGWAQAAPTFVAAPSLVVTPPRGTALLFAGNVAHAGMAVEAGTRVVLVASFSAKGATERELMRTTEARWEGAAVTRSATPTYRVNELDGRAIPRRRAEQRHLGQTSRSSSSTWQSPFP